MPKSRVRKSRSSGAGHLRRKSSAQPAPVLQITGPLLHAGPRVHAGKHDVAENRTPMPDVPLREKSQQLCHATRQGCRMKLTVNIATRGRPEQLRATLERTLPNMVRDD